MGDMDMGFSIFKWMGALIVAILLIMATCFGVWRYYHPLPICPCCHQKIQKMRPLIIGAVEKEAIKNLVDYAEKNPFSMDDLLDTLNKEMKPAGDMDRYSISLPVGYRVVYTIEHQPAGKVRHLSVSVDKPGNLPNPESLELIMHELGFNGLLYQCNVSMEQIGRQHQAVNVLEIVE